MVISKIWLKFRIWIPKLAFSLIINQPPSNKWWLSMSIKTTWSIAEYQRCVWVGISFEFPLSHSGAVHCFCSCTHLVITCGQQVKPRWQSRSCQTRGYCQVIGTWSNLSILALPQACPDIKSHLLPHRERVEFFLKMWPHKHLLIIFFHLCRSSCLLNPTDGTISTLLQSSSNNPQ